MKITFIGDPHGKIDQLVDLIKGQTGMFISVGDTGFEPQIEKLRQQFISEEFYSVVGNHDWIPERYSWPYMGDHCYFPEFSLFTIRGANSIDKHLRTEGLDWFSDEELNYKQQCEAYDVYVETKPKIVVSHDCPQSVMQSLFGYSEKSQTRIMLEHMFQVHQPELWVFGHHHKSKDVNINGTRFVCLSELETLTIEL